MQRDDRYRKIIHENEYVLKMQNEVLPYLERRVSEAWIPCAPENRGRVHVLRYLADKARGVVVISHGFSESAQKYPELIYYFLQEHYHVYFPEHCGHGLSYRLTDDPSLVHLDRWNRYSRDFLRVSRLIRKAHPGMPLYLFAHSMGGAVAAIAAAREPYIYQKSNLVFSDDPSSDGKCPLSCCNQNFPGSLQNRERNEVCSRPEAI